MKSRNTTNRSPAQKKQNSQLDDLSKLLKLPKSKPVGKIRAAQVINLPDVIQSDPSKQFWKEMNTNSPQLAWEHLFGKVEDSIQDQAAKDLFLQLYTPLS